MQRFNWFDSDMDENEEKVILAHLEQLEDGTYRTCGTYEYPKSEAARMVEARAAKALDCPIGVVPDGWQAKGFEKEVAAEE